MLLASTIRRMFARMITRGVPGHNSTGGDLRFGSGEISKSDRNLVLEAGG